MAGHTKSSQLPLALPWPVLALRAIEPIQRADRSSARARRTAGGDAPDPPQYSLRRVIATWAMAAVPMAVLAWGVAPVLADHFDGATAWPRAILVSLILGLGWQLILVGLLVRREQGTLSRSVLRDALWLRAPRSPRTGRSGSRVWLLLVPLIFGVAAVQALPSLPVPAGRDLSTFLASPAGHSFLSGNWTWFALILLMLLLNTVLGEELLFRGLLLPRMLGVFGRATWLANAILFAAYHLHVPWAIPGRLVTGALYAWPTQRDRSAWIGIAVHSAQSVVLALLVLKLVLA